MSIRKGYHEAGFIKENGVFLGLSLGYDFTTEHQCGIDRIKSAFGVGANIKMGLEARLQTTVPSSLVFTKTGDNEAFLVYLPYDKYLSHTPPNTAEYKKAVMEWAERSCELNFFKDETIAAGWDEKSFAIRVRNVLGEDNVFDLELVYKAFLGNRITMGLSPAKVWVGHGLKFFFVEAFDEEMRATILADDVSHEKLMAFFKKSGIEKKLSNAGCRYYALNPKWGSEDEKTSEIRFWLNPMQQDKNNSGWVTMADLEAWIQGKGPIVKS